MVRICCTISDTACKPTARPEKEASHPDRNAQFEYLNRKVKRRCWQQASRRFRWTPKRKNWWATSRTPGGNGAQGQARARCGSTTSSSRDWAERLLMACTIWDTTPAGSTWAWTMTRLHSPWRASAAGGTSMGQDHYPRATRAADHGGLRREQWLRVVRFGNGSCSNWLMKPDWTSPSATSPGHQQMEQDRASPVLLHQPELARQAARQLCGDPQVDRGDHD